MATSAINIKANAQEVINLRKRMEELKATLSGMRRQDNTKLYDKLNNELQQSSIRYNKLTSEIQRYVAEQNRASQATSSSANEMLSLFAKIGGTTAFIGLGKQVMDVRNEFQQLEIAFGTMLKSTDKAASLMKDLTKFAAETPFGLQSAASGAKQLLAYGSTADTVIKELTMLGDVAAGTGQQIGDLVYLYGTLRTQGRAYLMDIRQFAGRGIPIYDELAKVLKINKDQVNDFVSAGKVGFKEVEQAFKNMTAQGGLYGGLMEQQSASIGGRMEALKDNIDSIFNTIGKDSEGVIYKSIDGINTLVENYDKVGKILVGLVATYGVYKTAVILNTIAESGWTVTQMAHFRALVVVEKAQKLLNATMLANPYVLVATVAMGVVSAMWAMERSSSAAEEAIKKANEALTNGEAAALAEQKELVRLRVELERTTKGTDAYNKVKQEIIDKFGKYLPGLDQEINKVGLLTTTYDKLTQAIRKSSLARAKDDALKNISEEYKKNVQESLKDIRKVVDELNGSDENKERLYRDLYDAILNGNENIIDAQTINKLNSLKEKRGKANKEEYDKEVNSLNFVNRALYKNEELYRAVVQAKKDNQKLSDEQTAINKLFPDNLGKVSTEAVQAGDDFKSAADKYNEAAKKYNTAKKYFEHVDSNKSMYSSEAWKAAKEEFETAQKAYEEVSRISIKQGESAAEKARKQAQEIADQNEKINQLLDKQGLDRRRQNEDLANQEEQAYINSISNAAERIRKQRDYDNKLELQALERQKEDYIRSVVQAEKEKFEAQEELEQKKNPKYIKRIFNPSSVKVDTSQYDNILGFNIAAKVNSEIDAANKAWNEYFIEFGNYQEKRKAIIEKYNQEIAQATQDGDKAALENKKQNALDELDNSVKNSAKLMAQLFADSSLKSVGEIQKIIDKAEMLMNYLATVKDEQGNATIDGKTVSKKDILNLGISESELKKLELSAQEVEALRNAINKLKGDLGGKSPFKQFESQVKDAYDLIKKGGKENIGQGISGIGGAIQGITPELKEFGNSMGQIFGEQTGDDINTIVDLLGNTAQVGQGVGKIMAGDVVGGIKDVVTGIGNIFAMGSEADKRHKEALKVINESVKAQEHAYQLALRLKSLEYEKGDTIFGDDPYGKAINAAKEYKDAIEDLKASLKGDGKLKQSGLFALFNKVPKTSDYAALQNIDIVTGHKKTGLFGWGKGKDTYSGILSVYPQLIDSQGKFNAELAKTILAERTMSDSSKATLQQMIDNADAIEEAYSVMKDYLTDIFGDLGNNMTDALVNAFQKGEDAAESFYDSTSGMLQNLVKDMINSAVIGPVIQKATEEAMKVMENTSLTNEQRMDKLMSIVDNALEQGLAASDTAKDLYDYANKIWKDKTGEDLYKPEESSQSSSRGGFETMTQDQAGEMNGRMTGMYESDLRREGYLKSISEWNQPISEKFNLDSLAVPITSLNESSLRIERMIEENRSIAINSYYELKDINKNTKELYEINEGIKSIKKNTDSLNRK